MAPCALRHDVGMTDLRALGAAVVDHRKTLGWTTRKDFARVTGLSYRVLGEVETGRRPVSPGTWAIIEQHLGWKPGTAVPVPSADAIRGMADAYAVAAELVERGEADLGARLVRALGEIGASGQAPRSNP